MNLFDTDILFKRVRLSLTISHIVERDPNPNKRCVLCNHKQHLQCISCGVRLCPKARYNRNETCLELFHTNGICLTELRKEFKKAAKDDAGTAGTADAAAADETAAGATATTGATAAGATGAETYTTPAAGQRRARSSRSMYLRVDGFDRWLLS